MSCKDWGELLIDRVADELNEEDAISLEQHLVHCDGCRAEESRLRELFDAVMPEMLPLDMKSIEDSLADQLRHRESDQRNRHRSLLAKLRFLFRHPVPAYLAPVLVIAGVVSGLWIGQFTDSDRGATGMLERSSDGGIPDPRTESLGEERLAWIERSAVSSTTQASIVPLRGRRGVSFSTAPFDAIDLARAISPDTL